MAGSEKSIKISKSEVETFRGQMLTWYDQHKRTIPWRVNKGEFPDPYKIWLSEIMCQQTTVQAVIPYFLKFIEKWPDVKSLAAADRDEIMKQWAGLGYYARARNLHKCAGVVANDLGCVFPDTKKELMVLPGIGDYTSSAIAAIAFSAPATVVDGNVERIMARYFNVQAPMPKVKPYLKKCADHFFTEEMERPGDFAQSLMDLGAMICTPKSPKCMICPVAGKCKGRLGGAPESLPKREPKKTKPKRYGAVYWLKNEKDEILLQNRRDTEMLGGMLGLPTSKWQEDNRKGCHEGAYEALELETLGKVIHSFTHFDLTLDVYAGCVDNNIEVDGAQWVAYDLLQENEFPTVFKKAVRLCKAL